MKKFFIASLFVLAGLLINQPSANATGFIYTNATYPITATGNKVSDLSALKKGTAHTTNILYMVELGNAGIDEAVKNGGISKIAYADVNEKSICIFWRRLTVNVYGE